MSGTKSLLPWKRSKAQPSQPASPPNVIRSEFDDVVMRRRRCAPTKGSGVCSELDDLHHDDLVARLETMLKDPDPSVRVAAAEHRYTSYQMRLTALDDPDPEVRAAAVAHRDACGEEFFVRALADEDLSVRLLGVGHAGIPIRLLETAALDPWLRNAALSNKKATDSMLDDELRQAGVTSLRSKAVSFRFRGEPRYQRWIDAGWTIAATKLIVGNTPRGTTIDVSTDVWSVVTPNTLEAFMLVADRGLTPEQAWWKRA